MSHPVVSKFDAARAGEYAVQSRIALAGYEACHELAACLLSAKLGRGGPARILVVGAGGTGQEILATGRLEPGWTYMAVDPSEPMLQLARGNVEAAGLADRVTFRLGHVEDLPAETFDAATLIGVLHHLNGPDAKAAILKTIATRLRPEAPFVLACNRQAYALQPVFLSAWAERWRMHGAADDEVRSKLATILKGADPPGSDQEIETMLASAGLEAPALFFSSLFWGAWIATRSRSVRTQT